MGVVGVVMGPTAVTEELGDVEVETKVELAGGIGTMVVLLKPQPPP